MFQVDFIPYILYLTDAQDFHRYHHGAMARTTLKNGESSNVNSLRTVIPRFNPIT